MKIGYDVTFNKGEYSGIAVYTKEVIPRISRQLEGETVCYTVLEYKDDEERVRKFIGSLYPEQEKVFVKQSFFKSLYYWIKSKAYHGFSAVEHRCFEENDCDALLFFYNFLPLQPLQGKKKIVVLHDLTLINDKKRLPTRKKRAYKRYAHTVRNSDLIITDSAYTKQDIVRHWPEAEGKIVVNYCGVNTQGYDVPVSAEQKQAVREKYNLSKDYIVFIGQARRYKNIEGLIRAYALLPQPIRQKYDLVLSHAKKRQIALAKKLGVQDHVKVLGGFAEADKIPLLKGSSLVCLVSFLEGFGLPIIEGMAAGVPVVTSTVTCLPEIAGDSAILVDPYSVEEIAKGIERGLTDDKLRADLIEKGRERAKCFTWENTAQVFVREIEKLVGKSK